MTEEQKIKCEEIYNLHFAIFSIVPMPFSSQKDLYKTLWTKSVISLAKVFNRDITEEEAEKIIDNNIDKNIMNSVISSIPILRNQSYKDTFWKIANYFDEEQKRKIEEIINSSEEKYKKGLEELLDNFHEGYVPWALLFHYGNMDTIFYYYNPIGMLFGGFIPLSFILCQMEGVENEFFEFLGASKDKTAEIIIDATVSLSEIFNKNMTKEEAEKLLFTKNDIEKVKAEGGMPPACLGNFCVFTEEFRKIIEEYEEDKYGIERVISAITNYFDNGNKEANNKENNNKNKINNVVENTAKEKIMSNNDELTLNLLIIGQTGVGKSSLINALFGRNEAKAGPGKPISTHIKKYETELDGKKVNLYDSMGFEVNNEKCIKDIKDALEERSEDKDIKDWFHSVTYCIQAGGLKIQDFDIKMIKQFVDEKYNVIIALTKSDQIGRAKREEFINIIKEELKKATEKDIMVITVSADPEQLDHMTEKPKPYGLEEYKAAILISWREIFINRIPVHIVKKLKEDIENAKSNAPRKGKDKELSNKIQEYFSNILNTNIQKYVRENIEKYYKITSDILTTSKNINISNKELDLNFRSEVEGATKETWEMFAEIWEYEELNFGDRIMLIGAATLMIPLAILENIAKPMEYLMHLWEKEDKIKEFIEEVSKEYIEKIGTEEFESEIRKIIINALNEIDKKIIKLN